MPKALTERPEFGNKRQIEAGKLYQKIKEAEVKASYLKTNYEVRFFKGEKYLFVMAVGSLKLAQDLALEIYSFDDENWRPTKIKTAKVVKEMT